MAYDDATKTRAMELLRTHSADRTIARMLEEGYEQLPTRATLHNWRKTAKARMKVRPRKVAQPEESPPTQPSAREPEPSAATEAYTAGLRHRLAQVRQMADERREDEDVRGFRDLVKLESELVAKLASLVPPPEPDPERDPANVAARDVLAAHLRRMIEQAEQAARR